MVPAGTNNLIKARASEIKAAVTEFNARSRTKIVVGKENPFPVGEQAIYSLDVTFGDRAFSIIGCRTMPLMVVELDSDGHPVNKRAEFLDEFLETLQ